LGSTRPGGRKYSRNCKKKREGWAYIGTYHIGKFPTIPMGREAKNAGQMRGRITGKREGKGKKKGVPLVMTRTVKNRLAFLKKKKGNKPRSLFHRRKGKLMEA